MSAPQSEEPSPPSPPSVELPAQGRVITLDGPAGCGKSTVAAELARVLGGVAFSSGKLYRAVTWLALERGIDLGQPVEVLGLIRTHAIEVRQFGQELQVVIDGRRFGAELHGSDVTREIHWVADAPDIRARLLPLQRGLVCRGPLVAEGRDMGTVVFPGAPVKVFLTASVEERARRRHRELEDRSGEAVTLADVVEAVRRRDRSDEERSASPLRPAVGALRIDTTELTVEEVVERIRESIPAAWSRDGG